jgi:hypothetical protein
MSNPNARQSSIDTREFLPPPNQVRIYNIFRDEQLLRLSINAQESLEQLWAMYNVPADFDNQQLSQKFLTGFSTLCVMPNKPEIAVNQTLTIFGQDARYGLKNGQTSTIIFTDYGIHSSNIFHPTELVKVDYENHVAIVSLAILDMQATPQYAARFLGRRVWGELHGLPSSQTVNHVSDIGSYFEKACSSSGCLMAQVQTPADMSWLYKQALVSDKSKLDPACAKTGFCVACDRQLNKEYALQVAQQR